jgi:hypothetical protein
VGAALIAVLASVAVSGVAGSRAPTPEIALDRTAFRPVRLDAETMMTPLAFDQSLRSDSALGQDSILSDPGSVPAVLARPVVSQPPAPVQVKSTWIYDHELSWYGPGMYGWRTACGYILTTTLIGVANRTLPCGTLITFKNPVNGRIVTAPVVDRGPYVSGRQWDLTGGLCVALDHCWTGPMYWRYG